MVHLWVFSVGYNRHIFMKLLYNTKYNIIDQNMSDSNVGGKKKMSSVNNIFILNGIIHETLSSKHNTPVTLQVYDYTQMFDSMDLEESVGDLFDSGVKDDTLALLYNANTNIKVKVKTPAGLSEEMTFKKLVLQGDTWGPTMAANQVDTIGKQLLVEQPQFLYKYKGHVPIGILGMIDDIVGVSEHGFNATQLNAFINIKTAEKKLQFGHNKCKTLTISHKNVNYVKSDLLIDHWVESHDKSDQLVKTFKGKIKMSEVTEQKYLGFVISSDGSNINNIEAKKKRAIGITKHIQYLIKDLGKFTIECGIIYLNSLLRSSILFAAEAMYDIKENDFRHIEMIEEDLLRKLFKTGKVCTIFQLYFEAGQIPA